MIRAKYCYSADLLDQWVHEEITLEERSWFHLTKFLSPESLSLEDKMRQEYVKHFGGYYVALGGPLNNPVTEVLNAAAVWHPRSPLELKDSISISVNGNKIFSD